jgi:NAD-dependent deacetylase
VEAALSAPDLASAARLLRASRSAVALTGAGISTPSGVPDFRSPGSGLWEKHDPMEVASLLTFRHHPEKFYEWIRPLAIQMMNAEPNPAHLALARLERAGILVGVVTQNIDNLHFRAGSRCVVEIHGDMRAATCVRCGRVVPTAGLLRVFTDTGQVPRCADCGGILKPNAIFYGEQLPYEAVREAERLFRETDLVLVIGSSLEVMPAALLPVGALNSGARLIIFNREPTYLDERADFVFRDDVALAVPRLIDEALCESPKTH